MSEDSSGQISKIALSTSLPGEEATPAPRPRITKPLVLSEDEDGRYTPRPRITKPLALGANVDISLAPRSRITRPLPPVEQAEQETPPAVLDAPLIAMSAGQGSLQDETGEEHAMIPPADTFPSQPSASTLR